MRILHLGFGFRHLRSGGLIEYAEDLMDCQAAQGHAVAYFCSGRHYGAKRPPELRTWRRGAIAMYEVVNSPIVHGGDRGVTRPELELSEPAIEELFRGALKAFRPDVLHIQELASIPSSLIEIAKAAGLPVAMTLQDYYPLCPTLKLYDTRQRLCMKSRVGEDCVVCCRSARQNVDILVQATRNYQRERLKSWIPGPLRSALSACRSRLLPARAPQPAPAPRVSAPQPSEVAHDLGDRFQQRRDVNLGRLNQIDLLMAQSERLREIYCALGVDPQRIRTVQLTLAHIDALRTRPAGAMAQPLVFATMNGCINPQKGADVVLGGLRLLRERGFGGRFRLIVWGGLHDSIREELLSFPEVDYRGWYNLRQLDSMLDSVDVGLMPSTWEEAYGFVGVEFLAKGIPVLGNARGGIVDYTREGVTGWLNRSADAEGLAAAMAKLIDDPDAVRRMAASVRGNRAAIVKSMAAHCEEVIGLYRTAVEGVRYARAATESHVD